MDTIERGPFVFTKRNPPSISGDECWEISLKCGAEMPTYFCIKNYGGEPGPGFMGWKLVSGGPFNSAGAYTSRDEAIAGVIPFMTAHIKTVAAKKLAEAKAMTKALKVALKSLS